MSDHETTVQTQSVRTLQVYTQIPPRSPRAEGGEETLMSVAGLGAQNRAQLINEWSGNIFGMSIDVAVVGTAQIEIVQQYWHEHQLCIEIFKIVYNTAWALGASMTEQCNTQFF